MIYIVLLQLYIYIYIYIYITYIELVYNNIGIAIPVYIIC